MRHYTTIGLALFALASCGSNGGDLPRPQPPAAVIIDGDWVGAWQSITGAGGAATMTLEQDGVFVETFNVVGTGTQCVVGPYADGKFDGLTLVMTLDVDGGNMRVALVLDEGEQRMRGAYVILGGLCAGDSGEIVMVRP